jgi:hypothetical protein
MIMLLPSFIARDYFARSTTVKKQYLYISWIINSSVPTADDSLIDCLCANRMNNNISSGISPAAISTGG